MNKFEKEKSIWDPSGNIERCKAWKPLHKKKESENTGIRKRKQWKERITAAGRLMSGLLYPPHCPVCDTILPLNGAKICSVCEKTLPWVVQPCCMKCGKMIGDPGKEYCDDCLRVRHVYDQGKAFFQYTGRLRASVGRIKSGSRREYLDYYADIMAECGQKWLTLWKPDVIIPVPMYWKKKNRRGYNQSEILAEKISRRTGISVMANAVRKVRDTRAQKELTTADRRKNLKGAFELQRELSDIRTVLIIDDIYTTGSTVDELAKTLKREGVLRVYFLTLCIGKGKKAIYIDGKM